MNKEYRYQFDKTGKKHLCPDCGKNRFVRYVDTETKEYLPEQYGRCDRADNCGYYLNPYKAGYNTNGLKEHQYKPRPKAKPQPLYFIPEDVLNETLRGYQHNTFVQNLLKLCPVEDVEKVISLYRIGTISGKYMPGSVTFPFIDKAGNIRAIQAKKFNDENHTTRTSFLHSLKTYEYIGKVGGLPGWLQDYAKNELKVSCLFGEHLLNKYPLNPIALVEAPKTAIIGTLYYGLPETPEALLWLAVYNKSSLTFEKCKALKGRKVVLFPDLKAFDLWNAQTQELKAKLPGTRFIVSDLLEKNATESELKSGADLADYLTQFDYKLFRPQPEHITPPQEASPAQASQCSHSEAAPKPEPIAEPSPAPGEPEPQAESVNREKNESVKQHYFCNKSLFNQQPENWIHEIEILETFFTGIQLKEAPGQQAIQYMPLAPPADLRRDVIGADGLLHIYYPEMK